MVVFGKTIYGQWFASYSIWVGREPSSCPYRTAGLMFTYKHTWQKGWVNRALRSFSKTGFWEMSEAVWPGADQSVTKITASFQTSFFFKNTFNWLPHCCCSCGLSRAQQAGCLAGLHPRPGDWTSKAGACVAEPDTLEEEQLCLWCRASWHLSWQFSSWGPAAHSDVCAVLMSIPFSLGT